SMMVTAVSFRAGLVRSSLGRGRIGSVMALRVRDVLLAVLLLLGGDARLPVVSEEFVVAGDDGGCAGGLMLHLHDRVAAVRMDAHHGDHDRSSLYAAMTRSTSSGL